MAGGLATITSQATSEYPRTPLVSAIFYNRTVAELLNYLRGDRRNSAKAFAAPPGGKAGNANIAGRSSQHWSLQRVERFPLHFRIGFRRPPGQGGRPGVGRHPRRDLQARSALARRRRNAVQHRPGGARRQI